MDIQKITKQLLRQNGWTQEQLAREIGIHPVTLCRILQKPSPPKNAYSLLVRYLSDHAGSFCDVTPPHQGGQ